jgi:DinB family protein
MAEHPLETTFRTALWRQFGAAIDMLENALVACPSPLWNESLWSDHSDYPQPSEDAAFWSITYHILFWLDVYLTGSHEGFAPPAPFTLNTLDPASVFPEQPYTKDELHGYLVQLRQKCQTMIAELSDEKAHHQVAFPRLGGKPMSFLELQLYNMRHVQEHAAQLSLFLGQHAIPDEALDWVPWAKDEQGL